MVLKKTVYSLLGTLLTSATFLAQAQAPAPAEIKIGVVTFLSGPAASPFGVPARNAAELMIEKFNAGAVPAPYNQKGIGGAPIKMVLIDESGTSTSVVTTSAHPTLWKAYRTASSLLRPSLRAC